MCWIRVSTVIAYLRMYIVSFILARNVFHQKFAVVPSCRKFNMAYSVCFCCLIFTKCKYFIKTYKFTAVSIWCAFSLLFLPAQLWIPGVSKRLAVFTVYVLLVLCVSCKTSNLNSTVLRSNLMAYNPFLIYLMLQKCSAEQFSFYVGQLKWRFLAYGYFDSTSLVFTPSLLHLFLHLVSTSIVFRLMMTKGRVRCIVFYFT